MRSSHPTDEDLFEALGRVQELRYQFEKNPYLKLKKRKYLIELRTNQYDLAPPNGEKRDAALIHPARHSSFNEKKEDFGVYPEINFENLPESRDLADFLDLMSNEDLGRFTIQKRTDPVIDLTDREQIIQSIQNFGAIKEFADRAKEDHKVHSGFPVLLKTLSFMLWGGLKGWMNPGQAFILHEKLEGKQNDAIKRSLVNRGGHSYQSNYISTIFRQRAINNVWKFIMLYIETNNAAFEKEYDRFKTCKKCERVLLKHKELFPLSHKSADGYGDVCKFCKNFKKNLKENIDFDFEGFEEEFRNEFGSTETR